MIVRILGEGQFQIDPASLPTLNALDDAVEKAVAALSLSLIMPSG